MNNYIKCYILKLPRFTAITLGLNNIKILLITNTVFFETKIKKVISIFAIK